MVDSRLNRVLWIASAIRANRLAMTAWECGFIQFSNAKSLYLAQYMTFSPILIAPSFCNVAFFSEMIAPFA